MNTSSRFVVAVHVLGLLSARTYARSRNGVTLMKSEEIAESVNTNAVVIRRILSSLQKAGLVDSRSGRNGGSELARPPEKITLRDVYEAVEPSDLFHLHYSDPDPYCPIGAYIQDSLGPVFRDVENALKRELQKRNMAEVTMEVMERSGLLERVRAGATFEEINEMVRRYKEEQLAAA